MIIRCCLLELVVITNPAHKLLWFFCSKRRFTEKQAEVWWAENRARVFEKYNVKRLLYFVHGGKECTRNSGNLEDVDEIPCSKRVGKRISRR